MQAYTIRKRLETYLSLTYKNFYYYFFTLETNTLIFFEVEAFPQMSFLWLNDDQVLIQNSIF